jgi:NADH-quinone oxidoreductase subunit A
MTITNDYLPILILILVGAGLAGMFTIIGLVVGPKLRTREKAAPFESGFIGKGLEGHRYDVKFFMTALVFLYPWTVQLRELGWFGFIASMVFISVLTLGLVYDWKKGALEWE